MSHNYRARVLQLLKPARLEPVLRNKRSHHNEKPACSNKDPVQPEKKRGVVIFTECKLFKKFLNLKRFEFYFLAELCGTRNLSSPTMDRTRVPCSGSVES